MLSSPTNAKLYRAVVGSLTAAWVADKMGRRLTLGIALAVRLVSITLESTSISNPVFFGGRFMGGFATGAVNALCMTYIGEVTPLPLRGVLTAAAPIALILGSFSAALMVNFTGDQPSRWAYRTSFVSGYGFVGVAVLFLPWMPESPWWLINHDREQRAIQALRKLGYPTDAEEQAAEMKKVLSKTKEETSGATYAECFRRSNLRRTIVSAMPLTIQTFSGVAFVASYATYYQQLAGYSTTASFHLFIAQQVLSGAGNVCSWFLVDKIGRRPLTLWGMVILTALLLITGGMQPEYLDWIEHQFNSDRTGRFSDSWRHQRHNRTSSTLLLPVQRHYRSHCFLYPYGNFYSSASSKDSVYVHRSTECTVCRSSSPDESKLLR